MNIAATISTNLQIMKLILSKYPDELTLFNAAGPEARYYKTLKGDADKARSALAGGGIAATVDPGEA